MIEFLKNRGWLVLADIAGMTLLAALAAGGSGSAVFALLFLAAPVAFGALMLRKPKA